MTNGRWQEQDLQNQTGFRTYDQQPPQGQYKSFPQQQQGDGFDPNRSKYEVVEYQPKKRSMFRVFLPLIIIGVIFILIMVGVVIIALFDPFTGDVELEVNINTGGRVVGDTLYIDTNDVSIQISNQGKGTALGNKIELKVSGRNIFSETVQYTGVDIGSEKHSTYSIGIDVIDEDAPLTITVKVFYDSKFHDEDEIP